MTVAWLKASRVTWMATWTRSFIFKRYSCSDRTSCPSKIQGVAPNGPRPCCNIIGNVTIRWLKVRVVACGSLQNELLPQLGRRYRTWMISTTLGNRRIRAVGEGVAWRMEHVRERMSVQDNEVSLQQISISVLSRLRLKSVWFRHSCQFMDQPAFWVVSLTSFVL